MSSNSTITCPNCKQSISIDEALTHQFTDKFEAEYKQKYNDLIKLEREKVSKIHQEEIKKKEFELKEKEILLNKEMQRKLQDAVESNQKKVEEEISSELKFFKEQNESKDKKLQDFMQKEMEMRKEKQKLEDEKKYFEIEKQRQMDKEREEISKKFHEEYRMKEAEKDKKINDILKVNEELQRKLEQGSQQTQGEVMELEIEEMLRAEFPYDEIVPVGKGVNGADIMQIVRDRLGRECGKIAWESKRTKAWNEAWIQKLKDDQRNSKAELAVIVTTVLPKDIVCFKMKDGIWITNFESVLGLASALRQSLIQITQSRLNTVGKNEKMEVLYNYLTGTEFKQRVEAIVETFLSQKEDLEKEKLTFQKMWSKREKQIQRIVDNTIGLQGDIEGLTGRNTEIKALSIDGNNKIEDDALEMF